MTEREGEKNRKIELGLKVSEERMVDKNTMNTTSFQPRKKIHFNKTTSLSFLKFVSFIE